MRRHAPLVLLLVAVALAATSVLAARHPARAAGRTTAPPAPLLSARRVPGVLVAGVADPALRTALDEVVADSPSETCVSVEIDGRAVYSHQPDLALAPASNVKLLTAVAVLHALGADHRFHTSVVGARPSGGTVEGDLTLVGGGDPFLSTKPYADHFADQPPVATSLEGLADRVVEAGVRRVTGRVVGDESRYDAVRTVPAWPARYYEQHQTGPLSALSVNQGKLTFPEHATEENARDVTVTDDPARFAAEQLTQLLRARGVVVDGEAAAGRAPAKAPELAGIDSPPLPEVVRQMLSTSDNQAAESLVKELGVHGGAGGTTAGGLAVLGRVLTEMGLPTKGLVLHDGSGLDRDDRASCNLIAAVLERAGEDSAVGKGLAVAGRTGTLRERFVDSPAAGHVKAKTGTLNDVTALSGFADATSGSSLTFSYVAEGATVGPRLLSVQDDLVDALMAYAAGVDLRALSPAAAGR